MSDAAASAPATAFRVRFRMPNALVLMVGCVAVAAALSWVLRAGAYQRREDPATGRSVVVAGTFHAVEANPVGPFAAVVAIPKGLEDAADVVFFVFLIGGAFAVVDRTGALAYGVDWLVRRLADRAAFVIPVTCLAFALGGALDNMHEEIIALIPALLVLTRRLGYDAVTAAAMSVGAAAVGAAFSPINPFQVEIAQKLSQLPLLSGWSYRLVFLMLALAIWIGGTMRYAARTRGAPSDDAAVPSAAAGAHHGAVLALVLATFVVFVYGVTRFGWGFDQMAALFFVMGAVAGLVGRLGIGGTADAFIEGFRSMTFAALLIGFARAIYVVLEQGGIVDTIVHGLVTPLAGLPIGLSAIGMMAVHTAIHVPVPSVSGQAVLTLPILVPLTDLLGLSRQTTVLAYQYGAGLCDLITPTSGVLMANLAAAGVRYDRWVRFLVPLYAALFVLGMLAIAGATAIGLR
ncbi:MAG TPA: Na+/H+ antiporter NhaC family protein [Gemmatimonadaceae bacterium]|nr:Na+/H+ antiporter NhaC family protein [Gemmatimonadaceae bacterium]